MLFIICLPYIYIDDLPLNKTTLIKPGVILVKS